MDNNELLLSMSNLLDQKLEPVNNRLNNLTIKVEKLDDTINNDVLPRLKKVEDTLDNDVLPRLKKVEDTLDNDVLPRLKKVENSINNMETAIEKDISPRLKRLEVSKEIEILPRLQNIEECYISTFKRYQTGIGQLENMQVDIDIMKSVLHSHSEKLQLIS